LETLVETSKAVPVGGNILVDRKKIIELVDQLRLTIPEEVRAAEDLLSQKDQILNIAQNDARRTKSLAEDELRDRLRQSEVVTQAEAKAADTVRDAEERITRMLQQSEAEAMSRRTEADAYALRSLRSMETELDKLVGSVRKGIEVLAIQASSNLNMHHYQEEEDHAGMLR
jgi:regulator of replication initiation timing